MGVAWRGRSGHGDGVHVLTGPVWVCGAQPGDVLQVRCLRGACGHADVADWSVWLSKRVLASGASRVRHLLCC